MLLQLDHVSKSFGALTATDDLSFTLQDGEALGVLGPNGAGKSTMFNLISGEVRADAGQIFFGGADITTVPAHQRCRLGIGRSYQIPHPFARMTVFENLLVAATSGADMSENGAADMCADVLDRTGLLDKANTISGTLTLLERKRLELARALSTRPRLLLLDEIAGGLTDPECAQLIETIEAVRAEGVSIIWVEHVVHALLSVADRLIVINFGQLLADGHPEKVMRNPKVQEVYMGIAVE